MKDELQKAIDNLNEKLDQYDIPSDTREKWKRQRSLLTDILDALN